jgi:hypothetical protein
MDEGLEIFGKKFTKEEWMDLAMDIDADMTEERFEEIWREFERVRQKRRAN